jgi:WD40 repeat protein
MVLLGFAGEVRSQEKVLPGDPASDPLPANAARLRINIPAGARVRIDSNDIGYISDYIFKNLAPGQRTTHDVEVALPPDGTWEHRRVYVQAGEEIQLAIGPVPKSRRGLELQSGHSGRIANLAFSPDGAYLVSASTDRSAILWDVKSGRQLRRFTPHRAKVYSAAFSPDGKWVVTGGEDGLVACTDVVTGKPVGPAVSVNNAVYAVGFEPQGRLAFAASGHIRHPYLPTGHVHLIDPKLGQIKQSFEVENGYPLVGAAVSPDTKRLAGAVFTESASWVVVWDIATQKVLGIIDGADPVSFSPDGRFLLTGRKLWDATNFKLVNPFMEEGPMFASFDKSGKRLVTCSPRSNLAILWDLDTFKELRRFAHEQPVLRVALSPDGKRLATSSGVPDDYARSELTLWNTETGNPERKLVGITDHPLLAAPLPDGYRAVTSSDDEVVVHDFGPRHRARKYRVPGPRRTHVLTAALDRDGKHILAGLRYDVEQGEIVVRNAATGEPVRRFVSTDGAFQAAALRRDGKKLLAASRTTAIEFAVEGLTEDSRWDSGESPIAAVAYRGDRPLVLLSDHATGDLVVHGLNDRENLVLSTGRAPLTAAKFGREGELVAAGREDGRVLLWDAAKGGQPKIFRKSDRPVRAVAFSRDGTRLAGGFADGTIAVWDRASGELKGAYQAPTPLSQLQFDQAAPPPDPLNALAVDPDQVVDTSFSNDGRHLALTRAGRAVELWSVADSPRPLSRFQAGFELRLVPPAAGAGAIPARGNNQVIAADVGHVLHFRIFDSNGKMVVDTDEKKLVNREVEVEGLRKRFKDLWPPHVLTRGETGDVLAAVTSLVDHPQTAASLVIPSDDGSTAFVAGGGDVAVIGNVPVGVFDPAVPGVPAPLRGEPLRGFGEEKAAIWSTNPWRRIRGLSVEDTFLASAAAFRSKGQAQVLIAATGLGLGLWDTRNGRRRGTYFPESEVDNAVGLIRLDPGGKWAVTVPQSLGFQQGAASLWDVARGRRTRMFETPLVKFAAISPQGTELLLGSDNQVVQISLPLGKPRTVLQATTGFVTAVGFLAGRPIAITAEQADGRLLVRDLEVGKRLSVIAGRLGQPSAAELSADGRRFVASFLDGSTSLWDTTTGAKLVDFHELKRPANADDGRDSSRSIVALAFDDEARRVAALTSNSTLAAWDIKTGEPVLIRQDVPLVIAPDKPVFDPMRGVNLQKVLAWTPKGDSLVSAGQGDPGVTLWDINREQRLWGQKLESWFRSINDLVFTPDGGRLVTVGGGTIPAGAVALWDVDAPATPRAVLDHEGAVTAVAFTPVPGTIVSGSVYEDATVWTTRAGQSWAPRHYGRHVSESAVGPRVVQLSPDGRRVLSCGSSGTLYDVEDGKSTDLPGDGEWTEVLCGAFSPDGRWIVTGGKGQQKGAIYGELLIWNGQTGERLGTLQTADQNRESDDPNWHRWYIDAVAFSADGRYLTSGSRDGTIILWDSQTGEKLRILRRDDQGMVVSLAFDPVRKQLISTSTDDTARVWDFATGDEILKLISLDHDENWVAVTPEGLFDGSYFGREHVAFRVEKPDRVEAVPLDRYFLALDRSELATQIRAGLRPMPDPDREEELGQGEPPLLVVPRRGSETFEKDGQPWLRLSLEVTDLGSGSVRPWAMLNEARKSVRFNPRGEPTVRGKVQTWQFELPLSPGKQNVVTLHCSRKDRLVDSAPAVYEAGGDGRPASLRRLFVVSIGLSRPSKCAAVPELKNPPRNASDFTSALIKWAPAVYPGGVHTQVLTEKEVTRQRIEKELALIGKATSPDDVLVIFLSGHGIQYQGKAPDERYQRYYFLTDEVSSKREEGDNEDRIDPDDLRAHALPIDLLAENLGDIPAARRLLIVDTCDSGNAVLYGGRRVSPYEYRGAIEGVTHSSGVFTLAASSAGQSTYEPRGLRHGKSLVTHSLLTHMILTTLDGTDDMILSGHWESWRKRSGGSDYVDVLDLLRFAEGEASSLSSAVFGLDSAVSVVAEGRGVTFPLARVPVR